MTLRDKCDDEINGIKQMVLYHVLFIDAVVSLVYSETEVLKPIFSYKHGIIK